jgi:hypothetical protein
VISSRNGAVFLEKAEEIDRELVAIGHQCLRRSPDAGNYLRGDERVDFIYASRPAARRVLTNATVIQTAFGEVRVVSTEHPFAADGGITQVPPAVTSPDPLSRRSGRRERGFAGASHAFGTSASLNRLLKY